jgi:hypothetical protein
MLRGVESWPGPRVQGAQDHPRMGLGAPLGGPYKGGPKEAPKRAHRALEGSQGDPEGPQGDPEGPQGDPQKKKKH